MESPPPNPTAQLPRFMPMTLDDVAHVAQLEPICFTSPWSPQTYRHEIAYNRNGYYWVVRPPESADSHHMPPILAYGGFWMFGDEAHIATIATHPHWRRQGLGRWILLNMLAEARTVGAEKATLEVRVSNAPAIALYTELGFTVVGKRKRYYPDNGEDALLMTLFRLHAAIVWRPLQEILEDLTSRLRLT